jgi:hypothetical protein
MLICSSLAFVCHVLCWDKLACTIPITVMNVCHAGEIGSVADTDTLTLTPVLNTCPVSTLDAQYENLS